MIGALLCRLGFHANGSWMGRAHYWKRGCRRPACSVVQFAEWQGCPPSGNWHEARGGEGREGKITMLIWRLLRIPLGTWRGKARSIRVDLHKMVAADAPGCYHTHPAWALRMPIAGGYVEELHSAAAYDADSSPSKRALAQHFEVWEPGRLGVVPPALCHRVAQLIDGASWSLWIRGPIVADVKLVGPGWPAESLGDHPCRN